MIFSTGILLVLVGTLCMFAGPFFDKNMVGPFKHPLGWLGFTFGGTGIGLVLVAALLALV